MGDLGWVRRVLVVEDQPFMRGLVAEALRGAEFDVHDCASASEALAMFAAVDPDVLVTDIDLGTRPNGVELAHVVKSLSAGCAIVFLTNYPSEAPFSELPAGSTFVNKSSLDSVDALISAVNSTLVELPVTMTPPLASDAAKIGALTRVQLDILRMIAEGWSNAEIAKQRGSSMRSVEKAVSRTFEALGLNRSPGVNPRVAAATLYARTFGLPVPADSEE
ncbi:response regulator transcription factor [Arthrobacter sp. efr-133-TYG-118]|uniref:response regulator transcription factor n=1 Tax=Arthrobacter sp. efr-133-TYG-118 TaxID=3040279 RepID=UPI00254A7E7F|nr:response regulator transcription factor [Arthrobacter sp. efr-133-TYG-118]